MAAPHEIADLDTENRHQRRHAGLAGGYRRKCIEIEAMGDIDDSHGWMAIRGSAPRKTAIQAAVASCRAELCSRHNLFS